MHNTKIFLIKTIVLLTGTAGFTLPAQARQQTPPVKASAKYRGFRAVDAFGTVEKRMASGSYSAVVAGTAIASQTTIRTGEDSALLIELPGNGYLRIGAKSVVQLNPSGQSNGYSCRILSGQAWAMVRAKSGTAFVINTPTATASTNGGLFGMGYDLESDQSIVSVGDGSAAVLLSAGNWKGAATAGQQVLYLRRPRPNIRLRAPEVVPQTAEQELMWKLLRAENWTLPNLLPNTPARLTRGNESKLRGMNSGVRVTGGDR